MLPPQKKKKLDHKKEEKEESVHLEVEVEKCLE